MRSHDEIVEWNPGVVFTPTQHRLMFYSRQSCFIEDNQVPSRHNAVLHRIARRDP